MAAQGWVIVLVGLGLVGVVLLVVAISAAQKRAAEARRAALAKIAAEHDFEFYPFGLAEADRGFWAGVFTKHADTNLGRFLTRFEGFSPFGQGHTWAATNLMVGRKDGLDWYVFDYVYHTTHSTGKSTITVPHPTGVVAVRLPLSLARLTLSPENIFSKIGNLLGMQELDFELEEFNKRYFVRGSDRKMAYDLLHPGMIEFLMQCPPRNWQMAGEYLVMTQTNYYEPSGIDTVIQEVQGFVKLVPEYVEQDHGLPTMYATPLD